MKRDQDDAWMAYALCAETDPDAFFAEDDENTVKAKAICCSCSARSICLEYALRNNHDSGVWGALTGKERQALRRQRARRQRLAGAA